jgi:hypothetical protein
VNWIELFQDRVQELFYKHGIELLGPINAMNQLVRFAANHTVCYTCILRNQIITSISLPNTVLTIVLNSSKILCNFL